MQPQKQERYMMTLPKGSSESFITSLKEELPRVKVSYTMELGDDELLVCVTSTKEDSLLLNTKVSEVEGATSFIKGNSKTVFKAQ